MPRAKPPQRASKEEGPPLPRPSPGELLGQLPAWPREWAQRVGRTATELGAHAEVHPARSGDGWELHWLLERRRVLSLRPGPQGVVLELLVPEHAVQRVIADPNTDEEFRSKLLSTPPVRGRRQVVVPLESARRVHTIVVTLTILSRIGPGSV